MSNTCNVKESCTTDCLFTGRPCTRYGYRFTSLLRVEHWFGSQRGRKTLWRASGGVWTEVATSTSARVLADRFTTGTHVVMPAGVDPNGRIVTPEVAPEVAPVGALF